MDRKATSDRPGLVPLVSDNIIQSKTLTFARYKGTEGQYNLLLCIKRKLQCNLVSYAEDFHKISLNDFVVHFDITEFPSYHRKLSDLKKDFNRLIGVPITFSFIRSGSSVGFEKVLSDLGCLKGIRVGDKVETVKPPVIEVNYGDSSGAISVVVNPLALPFFLYIGKGVGFTPLDFSVAAALNGFYSKRIYELVSDWIQFGATRKVPIDELKNVLCVPKSFPNSRLKEKVLSKAKAELDASFSDIRFDFDMRYDSEFGSPGLGKKPASNCVVFTMRRLSAGRRNDPASVMSLFLSEIADPERRGVCKTLASEIVSSGKYSRLRSKFRYYNGMIGKDGFTRDDYSRVMLRIVLDSTGVDLRNDRHVRAARRLASSTRMEVLPVGELM